MTVDETVLHCQTQASHPYRLLHSLPPSTWAYVQHDAPPSPSNGTPTSLTLYAVPALLSLVRSTIQFIEESSAPRRRMRCPPQDTVRRPAGRRLIVGPSCPEPAVPWSPCPHPRSASTCPVSGVSVRCPRVRCPGVRCPMSGCPMSGCGRPASRVGVRAFCVGVPGVRTGGLRVGASARRAATRPGGPGPGRPAISANGSGSCPSPSWGR
jgi:hypothetical protein